MYHDVLPFPIPYFSPSFYPNLLLILFTVTINTSHNILTTKQLSTNKKWQKWQQNQNASKTWEL